MTQTIKKKNASIKSKVRKSPGEKSARKFYAICIGASAGGLDAISKLVAQFPDDINAAVFVVMHLAKNSTVDTFIDHIQRDTRLKVVLGEDQLEIKPGQVYVAPPDAHLLAKQKEMLLGHGPPENRFRPSIDALFRSAAANFGERSIGIILTGMLNDGTSGMGAIKNCGGHCMVQDPNDAEFPDMPLSVLSSMEVDVSVAVSNMGTEVERIVESNVIRGVECDPRIAAEARLSEKMITGIGQTNRLGKETEFSCPDCGGQLWKIKDTNGAHYRCHIGHAYPERELTHIQKERIEQTMWVAIRMMEERKFVLNKIAGDHQERGRSQLSRNYWTRAKKLEEHIARLKHLILDTQ